MRLGNGNRPLRAVALLCDQGWDTARARDEEHPGRSYVAVAVEAETDPLLVWLKPVPRNAS